MSSSVRISSVSWLTAGLDGMGREPSPKGKVQYSSFPLDLLLFDIVYIFSIFGTNSKYFKLDICGEIQWTSASNTVVRHHDSQYKDTQHYDTQHNDTQHNNIQHDDTQYNDTQQNNTQHNDTEN
jgi:hypothetical protein